MLIGRGEPPAVLEHRPQGAAPALLLCDHAGPAVPAALGDLGVPRRCFSEHIAYDLGALAVARILSDRLDAPLLHTAYSRLVIDANRFADHPASIPTTSDGVPIPGNRNLGPAAREARFASLFRPYHERIAARLDGFAARGIRPLVVCVHTFTPRMDGRDRPWHVGVLWHRDAVTARALLAALGRRADITVGDNEPYSGVEPLGYTSVTHCEARGLPHALLEIRQDLVADHPGQQGWADILEAALREAWPPLAGDGRAV